MKWTKEKIDKHLYKDDIYGPGGREGCICILEHINDFLTERKLHGQIDFEKIVDGTFWGKIDKKRHLLAIEGKSFGRPRSGCFEDFLEGLNENFQNDIISDDYKFPKLPRLSLIKNKYTSVADAAKYKGKTPRRIQQMANEKKLVGIYNDKTGRLEKILTKSIPKNK